MEEYIEITEASKSISEAILTRHSVREFTNKPIPPDVLEKLLALSTRSPSWKNAQPWQIHVVSGQTRDRLSDELVAAAKTSPPNPETAWLESYPSSAKKRMFDLGMKVYGVAGIDRKDKVARDEFMLNNFRFFGAPTALLITTTFDFNFFVGIDLGCYVESILLLAREYGLGTCAQAALGAFPNVVKEVLSIPDGQKVVMGISIGYPKVDSNLNRFHSPRESLSDLVKFYF
jgi:nitroreductase